MIRVVMSEGNVSGFSRKFYEVVKIHDSDFYYLNLKYKEKGEEKIKKLYILRSNVLDFEYVTKARW